MGNLIMRPYEYNATVLRIIDGDSIEVDIDLGFHIVLRKRNIRLLNVDSPESRTSDPIEKQFGLLTKQIVESILPIGSKILLRTQLSETDKFGRILGIVETETILLNAYLIENHYAVAYNGQNKKELEKAHLANRQYLIENGLITINEN